MNLKQKDRLTLVQQVTLIILYFDKPFPFHFVRQAHGVKFNL